MGLLIILIVVLILVAVGLKFFSQYMDANIYRLIIGLIIFAVVVIVLVVVLNLFGLMPHGASFNLGR